MKAWFFLGPFQRKSEFALFFPIIAILVEGSVASFFERICLARCSIEALNGSVQAFCILQFFQLSSVGFGNMAQVFVGEYIGLNQSTKIGNCIWQMIWLSLLSMLFIFPLNPLIDFFFFKGTEQREIANNYYRILISGNFLFPIGVVLSAFFLAQGKKWLVVGGCLISCFVNALLNLLLTSGSFGIFPPLGAIGAASSRLIAKLAFCIFFFFCFLSRFNREHYCSYQWKVKLSSLLGCK